MSTKGEYGVRAMLELSLQYGDGPIPLRAIAAKQDISEHYLEQLFGGLRKSGLVKSVRGAQGGYELSRDPSEISVGSILRVLEGPIGPTECATDEHDGCECTRLGFCAAQILWKRVGDAILSVVDNTTLQDLVDETERLARKPDSLMYHI